MFATRPQLAGGLLEHACELGTEAAAVTGDEVYGGRDLRQRIRGLGLGYVLAVRSNHMVTLGSGKAVTAGAAAAVIPARAWQRMPTGSGTKGIRDYDWAKAGSRQRVPGVSLFLVGRLVFDGEFIRNFGRL